MAGPTQTRPFLFSVLLAALLTAPRALPAANHAILGWNNLGMHCMDSDYSVFSILPPYNTFHAQIVVGGRLLTNWAGYNVTYQAVADPNGSINSTSLGKTTFFDYVPQLFGLGLAVDQGLPVPGPNSFYMPGLTNIPRMMEFEPAFQWFAAYGVPITPFDDAGRKNPYPLMRLIAWDALNHPVATNDIVLPVSDEMDCRSCHASGTTPDAAPLDGWVWVSDPERDYRLNILRLHDGNRFTGLPETMPETLATNGFNVQGLYRTVVADGKPVLCAKCHLSEALPGSGVAGIPPLTESVHARHATVVDPDLGMTLDDSSHRAACYRCHPGSTTRCLRGVMGATVANNGSLAIQCQDCHGSMSAVGSSTRTGWLQEPNCQACHTGTATSNNGQIRYTSALDTNGLLRAALNQTFATTSNAPAAGLSLYRFSTGHGGVKCEGCHGSTHAEYPSIHPNDNLSSTRLQGHTGTLSECTACHTNSPSTVNGGPHGMHPVGQTWVSRHPDLLETVGTAQCQVCHGADYRGTVLSRSKANRTISAFGSKYFWRGFQIGCYTCHQGPRSESANPNSPAVVSNLSTNTASGAPVTMRLPASDLNGNALTLRIVSQPAHGTVGLSGSNAIYVSEPGFVGADSFTFAAWDGSTDSNLATGAVAVAQGPFSIAAQPHVPATYPLGWPVPFGVVATPSNAVGTLQFLWSFGDGSLDATNQYPAHSYAAAGTWTWTVICSVTTAAGQARVTNSGHLLITPPVTLALQRPRPRWTISWPLYEGDALLEWSPTLGPTARWTVDTNLVIYGINRVTVTESTATPARFYRLRKL